MKKRVITFLLLTMLLLSLTFGASALSEGGMPLVADSAGLLTEEENASLNSLAEKLTEAYGCEIIVVTVPGLEGWNVEELSEAIYSQYGFGCGEEKSCVMLLLSMEERDFDMLAHGYGNTVFTDYGKEQLMDCVLPYLGRNDWYGGFYEFISLCGSYLETAQNGAPVDVYSDYVPGYGYSGYDPGPQLTPVKLVIALIIGLIAALIVSGVQKAKMKSTAIQTRADRYMSGLALTESEDRYTHTTKSKTPRSTSSGGSRSGGGTHVNSGGFSHHSGKF